MKLPHQILHRVVLILLHHSIGFTLSREIFDGVQFLLICDRYHFVGIIFMDAGIISIVHCTIVLILQV